MTDPEIPGTPVGTPVGGGNEFDRTEFDRRRKSRSIVTGIILVGVVILFYFITIARISS